MLALVAITGWHWVGFIACVLIFLALDLGVFHRHAHAVKFKEALVWSLVWFSLAMLFALALEPLRGKREALQFVTGYLIELSLSMDNVFVIALVFAYFRIPREHQHRVLYWGILGALMMRGLMIGLGIALITLVDWVLYIFGAFLLYSGFRMLFVQTEVHPENNRVVKWVRKLYPVTPELHGQRFMTKWEGRKALTPLALVLVMVETSDLLFAVDSIPAVFAVTRKPFIVFTSNVFAILGLRSLYFLLAGAIGYFRYLKYGLPLVLVFMGVEMLLDPHEEKRPFWFQVDIPTSVSLLVVAGILLVSIVLSVTATRREEKRGKPRKPA
jgi:tellurite resistance protein TerC